MVSNTIPQPATQCRAAWSPLALPNAADHGTSVSAYCTPPRVFALGAFGAEVGTDMRVRAAKLDSPPRRACR